MTTSNPVDPTVWQREQQRRQLLVTMGIEPLVSRTDWPGAAPASRSVAPRRAASQSGAGMNPRTSIPPVSGQSQTKPANQKPVAERTDSRASDQGSVSRVSVAKSVRGPQTSAPPPSADGEFDSGRPIQQQSNPVVFQLLIASAGGWLWVERLSDGLLRKEQLQLVQGMARAMAGAVTKVQHLQFDWPIQDHPHLPQDLNSARHAVGGQLERVASEAGARGVVIMGENTGEVVLQPVGLQALAIPATLQMVSQPQLKRAAWSVLQPHASAV